MARIPGGSRFDDAVRHRPSAGRRAGGGAYRVQVDTPTRLHPPQTFSLVVTGDLKSDLVPV